MTGKSKKQKAKSRRIARYSVRILLMGVVLIFGCSERSQRATPTITVSILPQKFFVERIAGDRFEVQVMVPPGADSHTYEPSARDVQNLANSAVYFRIGYIDMEQAWMNSFLSVNPRMKVTGLPEEVSLIRPGQGHTGIDPHVWLSPAEVRKIAAGMLQAFIELDPEHAINYQANYGQFMKELDTLDRELAMALSPLKGKTVIVYHPALAYLARDYGFHQVAIEEEGKPPSARHIREVINLAEKENIRTILIQHQMDADMARSIANEINGQVSVIDPLAYDWMANMREIARLLNNTSQP